jgi:site-specific recombinase XerD
MHQNILKQFQKDITIKGFSKKTQSAYINCISVFLREQNSQQLNSNAIKDFLFILINERNLSNSTIRIYYSAIKFLFAYTLGKKWELEKIPQIKQKRKLPSFFTFKEIEKLLRNANNIKHKAMLMIIYSSGLRVSECSNLKINDITRHNMRLKISQAKGFKDRYTILSETCLLYLENYWRAYRPQLWLFPGRNQTKPLSVRAIQHAFYLAKKKAGIIKAGGVHCLRHSFATHFLEAGGGVFQLQKLLGHKKLKTTLVYVHLSEEKIVAKNPLDFFGNGDY